MYASGGQEVELVAREGKLFVTRGGQQLGVIKTGEWQFAMVTPGGKRVDSIRLVPGPDGRAAYAYGGTRALRRQPR